MADNVSWYVFAMVILLFRWLLDRAYGLITHAAQRSTQMGICWVFTGTYLGAADLTCIKRTFSNTYGVLLLEENVNYLVLAAESIVGRSGQRCLMGEDIS
jgi:hypothetical protein